jgi:ubiquinone/menaquinone biosynthesis C-methylase UbiE
MNKPSSNNYQPPVVSSNEYTQHYYQTCEGYDEFQSSKGQELTPRLKIPLDLAGIKPGMRVVDIGCGRGEIIYHCILKDAEAYGLDYSLDAVRIASDNLREIVLPDTKCKYYLSQSDARCLPYKSGSIDRVFMLDVVEHLYPNELEATFREVLRILKPGGKAIIHTMPNTWYYHIGYPVYRVFQGLRGNHLPANPRDRWPFSHLHVNEQSPIRLSRMLNRTGFNARVWLQSTQTYDYESNRFVRWGMKLVTELIPMSYVFCNDIFAVGIKSKH